MKELKASIAQSALGFGGLVAGVALQSGDVGGLVWGGVLFIGGMTLMGIPKPDNFIEAPVTTFDRVLSVAGMVLLTAVAIYAAMRVPDSTEMVAHATRLLC